MKIEWTRFDGHFQEKDGLPGVATRIDWEARVTEGDYAWGGNGTFVLAAPDPGSFVQSEDITRETAIGFVSDDDIERQVLAPAREWIKEQKAKAKEDPVEVRPIRSEAQMAEIRAAKGRTPNED